MYKIYDSIAQCLSAMKTRHAQNKQQNKTYPYSCVKKVHIVWNTPITLPLKDCSIIHNHTICQMTYATYFSSRIILEHFAYNSA